MQKLGFTEYLFPLSLQNIDNETMVNLRKHIQKDQHITYAFVDISRFQILFMTSFEDNKVVDNFSRNLRKQFGTIIQEQNYYLVQKQLIFDLFPKGIT